MSAYPEFHSYTPELDVDSIADEETLRAELKKTRGLVADLFSILEDSRDGIFVTDALCNVLFVNKGYEKMSGVSREEFLGKNLRDLEGSTFDKSGSVVVMETGKQATIEQLHYRTKITTYVTSTPIFDKNGNMRMIVTNNRDFRSIDQLKRELEQSRNLARNWEEKVRAITAQSINKDELYVADEKMYEVLYTANKVARTDSPILLTGESGTGKEELAKYIHQNSARAEKSFITINCGAISPNLIESELFGYEKGAFTGASSSGKLGFFEVADQGTLFLDEIGELPFELQAKLLRTLQNGEVIRVGGTRVTKVDVRILAATNRNLLEMVNRHQFREDLYYRLNVVEIAIPPLRERKDDIMVLADFFLKKFNEKHHVTKRFGQQIHGALRAYAWPGNVRELRNLIELLVMVAEGDVISASDLMLHKPSVVHVKEDDLDLKVILERTEYEYIQKYYSKLGNLREVADKLKVNAKTLSRRRLYLQAKYG